MSKKRAKRKQRQYVRNLQNIGQKDLTERRSDFTQFLFQTGHLEAPFGIPSGFNPDKDDPFGIDQKSDIYKDAVRSWKTIEQRLDPFCEARYGEASKLDDEIGPATLDAQYLLRCGAKDHDKNKPSNIQTAYGSGNWKGCHDIGDFHAVNVVERQGPPAFLAPLWEQVKENVIEAYAEVGLRVFFNKPDAPANTHLEFVNQSDGWIGLAIVCNNCTCSSSPIFNRYLATYRGGSTSTAIIQQWTSLVKHELGHNTGMSHTRGGVMNPSIVNGLPISWRNDPAWKMLVARFGGVPVPLDNDPETYRLVFAREYADGRLEKWKDVPKSASLFPF